MTSRADFVPLPLDGLGGQPPNQAGLDGREDRPVPGVGHSRAGVHPDQSTGSSSLKDPFHSRIRVTPGSTSLHAPFNSRHLSLQARIQPGSPSLQAPAPLHSRLLFIPGSIPPHPPVAAPPAQPRPQAHNLKPVSACQLTVPGRSCCGQPPRVTAHHRTTTELPHNHHLHHAPIQPASTNHLVMFLKISECRLYSEVC